MNGKFFAVGIGPGDPELLTIKAIKTIKESDVIAVPDSGADTNIALQIVAEYIDGKDIMECKMPMTREKVMLEEYHRKSTEDIAAILESGKDLAFLTLGDPAIYSTVMYVHKRLKAQGYTTAMIPGIPSFCAAAASLNDSLCEANEPLQIIPASYDWRKIPVVKGTRVFMKSGKDIIKLRDDLSDKHAMMVERASMKDEIVFKDLNELQEPSSYFSLVVVKDDLEREN